MKSKPFQVTAVALVAFLALAFLVPKLLGVTGSSYWILAAGLALIGLIAAGVYLWFEARETAAAAGARTGAPGAAGDELSGLLNEAEERLRASRLGARFANLPALFVIGPRAATKTTAIVQSGLDPELLAGQVYQEGNTVAPTRFVNAWFARQWIFIEPGQMALADAGKFSSLVRRLRPGPLAGGAKGAQSPRAVLVCFDCEEFLKARGPETTAAAARDLREKLVAISQALGISLPVYVLFAKADRIPYFLDYFHTLGNDEAAQVLGSTLPTGSGKGAYDEEQTARLNAALDQLYLSLAEHRIDFLGRESDAERLPGSYEFPREFRKFRNLLVQFLLDVCRPSQLNATPFLRGFYFAGVRPVMVRDAAPAPVVNKPRSLDAGATGVFHSGRDPGASMAQESSAVRRAPQWVFLRQLFAGVVLADESALGVSAVVRKPSILKRALLASATGLALLLLIAWTVSFTQNRGLEAAAIDAAAAVKANRAAAAPVPSLDELTKLDKLRQSVETIGRYNRDGAPWSYRWGLYVGEDLYPQVRKLYFQRFAQLLFQSTQDSLLANLRSLPPSPSPTDSYQYPYDSLKSYLITTSNHDKSTRLYLSPVLYSRWEAGKSVDPARAELVRRQFDFYSDELKFENPFSSENDSAAVERARKYLGQFQGIERVYRFMLAEADKTAPSLNFNQKFPGSAQTVVNGFTIDGAFTKTGFPLMQDAIKHADKYFAGEQWVLGSQAANIGDLAKLQSDLRTRYLGDYADQWRDYLKHTVVVGYTSIADASKKLSATASSQSPLLAMFCMASQNVGADPDLAKSFKPLLAVMPSSCGEQYVGPANQEYMKALNALQISLAQITSPDPNDPNVAQAASNATAAKVVTGGMAQGFGVDPLAPTVQKLIEDPIAYVEPLVKGLGAAALNKGGKNLCAQFRALMVKFPFNPTSSNEATLQDVNAMFKPGEGALWQFYQQNLQKLLPKQGATYVPLPGGNPTLLPNFVSSFNRLAAFSNALYAGGADPHFTYSLRPSASEGIKSVTLNIDGQTLQSDGKAAAKQFNWPGSQQGVNALVNYGGSDLGWQSFPGLWGVFRFFAAADKPATGASSNVEWVMRSGTQVTKLPDGRPMTERIELDMGASPPVFQRGYLSSLTCAAEVAK